MMQERNWELNKFLHEFPYGTIRSSNIGLKDGLGVYFIAC